MARPRIEPATALAPLNHMLNNGFFFIQGFANAALLLELNPAEGSEPVPP